MSEGHLEGEDAAEVRALLRGLDLIPVRVAPVAQGLRVPAGWWASAWERHLRSRRRVTVADLLDGVATLLRTGTPLAKAWEVQGSTAPQAPVRQLCAKTASTIRQGGGLSEAMRESPAWFDSVDIAMTEAAELTGDLPRVLERLTDRHLRSSAVGSKIAGALAYPAVVAAAGVGVWLFLSTKTLPPIMDVLREAEVAPPSLTVIVASVGQWALRWLPLIASGVLLLAIAIGALIGFAGRTERGAFGLARLMPRALRRAQVAALTRQLASLTGVGVPVVDALRTSSKAISSVSLRAAIDSSCQRVTEGAMLSEALAPKLWFDEELIQLVSLGERSGELDSTLSQAADRYERQAQRMVDRLAAALEPAAIIGLAALIGIVVMAAILPMLKLQEVLR